MTFSQALNEAIRAEMRRDESVIIIGEDIAGAAGRAHLGLVDAWGGPLRATSGLITEFGERRVIDTPIAEMGFVGAAVGAAMTGLRPIVEIMFVDLIGVCYDQIVNQAAKMHYMMGGQHQASARHPDRVRKSRRQAELRRRRGGAALADAVRGPRARAGPEGRRSEHRVQRQGACSCRPSATTGQSS